MALGDPRAFVIRGFFMLLIMAMVGVDEVFEFANFVLEVYGADFEVVEVGVWFTEGLIHGSGRLCRLPHSINVDLPFNCWRRPGNGCLTLSMTPGRSPTSSGDTMTVE